MGRVPRLSPRFDAGLTSDICMPQSNLEGDYFVRKRYTCMEYWIVERIGKSFREPPMCALDWPTLLASTNEGKFARQCWDCISRTENYCLGSCDACTTAIEPGPIAWDASYLLLRLWLHVTKVPWAGLSLGNQRQLSFGLLQFTNSCLDSGL